MNENLKKIVKALGWKLCECVAGQDTKAWEISQHSPAGEDFSFCVEDENFVENVRKYADEFDPDEHAEFWVSAKGSRRDVTIPSIRELINDADAISRMLQELASAICGNKPAAEEFKAAAKTDPAAFKWVVTRTYNFDSDCTAVEFDTEREAAAYMRNWYLRDLESERQQQQEMDEDERNLREEDCFMSEETGYARIAWKNGNGVFDDDYSNQQLEMCEYVVIQASAPDPALMDTSFKTQGEKGTPVSVRVFLWDGITEGVQIQKGAKGVAVIEVINCDKDYSDRKQYDALFEDKDYEEAEWTTDSLSEEDEEK